MPRSMEWCLLFSISTITCGCVSLPDPHSFSRTDQARATHIDLDLNVDFETRTISGTASLVFPDAISDVTLDTADLEILDVSGDDLAEQSAGEAVWSLGARDPILGAPLEIRLARPTRRVTVTYRTKPEAGALQWLSPAQTADKRGPFLFTQSQPILARSWFPCQDSPEVRTTYSARVRVPPGMVALMSAENPPPNDSGVYEFRMPQAIPSYLFALAVGYLESESISGRCAVYAEASVLDSAVHEFAETERMIQVAEKLYGPYRWGRYDILVLPPSFPWGGMENPRLTFCTPTILAGDRSLTALIAHELAHSWSGNLVTNATWDDFWINEGFTVYFEHRIVEQLYGKEYDEMLASLEFDELATEIEELEPADTSLRLNLAGRDPNDGMTSIPYEKGYFFLRTCEKLLGRERWDSLLRSYFDNFAFLSMTSEEFLEILEIGVGGDERLWGEIGPEEWIFHAGLPSNVDVPESKAFERVESEVAAFLAGKAPAALATPGWSTHEWLHFLRELPQLSDDQLVSLDEAYGLTGSNNAEIASQWLRIAIAHQYAPARTRLVRFLESVGRLKLIVPLYTDLTVGTDEQLRLARRVYERARSGYHPIATKKLDGIVR